MSPYIPQLSRGNQQSVGIEYPQYLRYNIEAIRDQRPSQRSLHLKVRESGCRCTGYFTDSYLVIFTHTGKEVPAAAAVLMALAAAVMCTSLNPNTEAWIVR